jgi:hypothetical protein
MIEIALALTVLLVALMAMSASTLRMHSLRRQNRERTVAHNAIRAISEKLQSVSRHALDNPAGWAQEMLAAVAPGGSLGNTFAVEELSPQEGAAFIGSITVITNETTTDADLGLSFGMPRDLDGDGVVGNANVGNAARILPIVVRTRWRGAQGDQEIVHPFYVVGY